MPRYFFNTRIGNELIADPEGEVVLEFPFAEAILDVWNEPATKH